MTVFRSGALALLLVTSCADQGAPGPEPRPGLATTWGETSTSRVVPVTFQRDDPEQPFAVYVIHYDDRAGLRALGALGGEKEPRGDGALVVRVVHADGVPWPSWRQGTQQFVEGRAGERYRLEIVNRSPDRFEVVATVDGLDVIDGRRGALDKRGYVLDAGATLHIDGFRESPAQVAAFRFGAVADSYAARTGEDANVGVIGVAFFGESGAALRARAREAARRLEATPFPGGFAEPPRSW
jgi:hypothetical protein